MTPAGRSARAQGVHVEQSLDYQGPHTRISLVAFHQESQFLCHPALLKLLKVNLIIANCRDPSKLTQVSRACYLSREIMALSAVNQSRDFSVS